MTKNEMRKVPGLPILIEELYHNKEINFPRTWKILPWAPTSVLCNHRQPWNGLEYSAHCQDNKLQNTPDYPEIS